jgi:hypothetical protein
MPHYEASNKLLNWDGYKGSGRVLNEDTIWAITSIDRGNPQKRCQGNRSPRRGLNWKPPECNTGMLTTRSDVRLLTNVSHYYFIPNVIFERSQVLIFDQTLTNKWFSSVPPANNELETYNRKYKVPFTLFRNHCYWSTLYSTGLSSWLRVVKQEKIHHHFRTPCSKGARSITTITSNRFCVLTIRRKTEQRTCLI